jgi:RNA polymerase sigma factor (sigma-70 family)
MDQEHSEFAKLQECEQALQRMKATIARGAGNSEEVRDDFELVCSVAKLRFMRLARSLNPYGSVAVEEAFEAMYAMLIEDIWNPNYGSMAQKFGSYLRTRPLRALGQVKRKYVLPDVSLIEERLDQPAQEGSLTGHEKTSDPKASDAFESMIDRMEIQTALATLPPEERHVIVLRQQGASNNEIAATLGISAATATRIYHRALERLKSILNPNEEL